MEEKDEWKILPQTADSFYYGENNIVHQRIKGNHLKFRTSYTEFKDDIENNSINEFENPDDEIEKKIKKEKFRQVKSESNGEDSNGNKTYFTLIKKFLDKMIVKIIVYCVLIFLFNYFYFESLMPCPVEPYDITLCVEWIQKI